MVAMKKKTDPLDGFYKYCVETDFSSWFEYEEQTQHPGLCFGEKKKQTIKPCNSDECKIVVIRKGTLSRLEDNETA